MRVRSTIFDSGSERELFDAISGAWEPRYHVYPHVPYANLIDLDPQQLQVNEIAFLHHTSVDYVLVEDDGKPLMAIEFDGMGHGISRNGRYHQKVQTKKDPNRAWKLDLKVRVAKASGFPLLVVSYDEKAIVDNELNLTVVHGIIGHFVASEQVVPRIQEMLAERQEELDELHEWEVNKIVQDMVISAEVEADLEFNPIARRAAQLQMKLMNNYGVTGWGYRYYDDPPRPSNCIPQRGETFDLDAFKAWWETIERIGCEFRLQTPLGEIKQTVWIRNFEGCGVSPLGFLKELAELVVSRSALSLLEARGTNTTT